MEFDKNTHKRCKLPEGAMVNVELEVIGYIDPESGEMKLATRCKADAPVSTVVGLMEQAKFGLLTTWNENADFDEQEEP